MNDAYKGSVEEFTEILDGPEDSDSDKVEGFTSFNQLYKEILKLEDIIIDIPKNEFALLKDGLRDIKYRTNLKMTKAGVSPDERRLEIDMIESDDEKNTAKVRIYFQKRKGISILSIKQTQDEM